MKIKQVKILGVKPHVADNWAAKSVVVGKTYDVEYDSLDGSAYFIDEDGDCNYGVEGAQVIYDVEHICEDDK